MSRLEQAIALACEAHRGQCDRQGEPYILHPLRVMMDVQGETARIVAVLHDVVEDTDVTLENIRERGYPEDILAAVELVTHKPDQSYTDYVVACKANETARQVKMADLRDNAALPRLLLRPDRFEADSSRMHRYVLSYRFLSDELDEAVYRRLMMRFESATP